MNERLKVLAVVVVLVLGLLYFQSRNLEMKTASKAVSSDKIASEVKTGKDTTNDLFINTPQRSDQPIYGIIEGHPFSPQIGELSSTGLFMSMKAEVGIAAEMEIPLTDEIFRRACRPQGVFFLEEKLPFPQIKVRYLTGKNDHQPSLVWKNLDSPSLLALWIINFQPGAKTVAVKIGLRTSVTPETRLEGGMMMNLTPELQQALQAK